MGAIEATPSSTTPARVAGPRGLRWIGTLTERAYRRLGRWYFHALVAGTVLGILLFSLPLLVVSQVPLWTGGFADWWYLWVFDGVALPSGLLIAPGMLLLRHRAVVRFLRGEPSDPVEVWQATVTRLPATAALVTFGWAALVVGPCLAWVGARHDFTLATYVGAYAVFVVLAVATGASYYMVYESALMPVAQAVAPHLPADFEAPAVLTIRRRLMVLTTSITVLTGITVAATILGLPDRDLRIWGVVLVTLALAGSYVGILTSLVSYGVTRRVHELSAALVRVGETGTSARLLPSAGDEFDDLGRAFNSMVDLLGEQERDLRDSRARLVAVADGERRRMERDLHDGAQQRLAVLKIELSRLERRAEGDADVVAAIGEMRANLADAITEVRALAHGIYPAALEHDGVVTALDVAGRQAGVRVLVEAVGVGRWRRDIETAIYFCCWEVIQRARREADGEARVTIGLVERGSRVEFRIADHLDRPAGAADPAWQYLRDRIGALGGTITVAARRGQGTLASGKVPLA